MKKPGVVVKQGLTEIERIFPTFNPHKAAWLLFPWCVADYRDTAAALGFTHDTNGSRRDRRGAIGPNGGAGK
jgi:hypothetical protein